MPNRTLCDVLEEARKCYETRNFAPILGMLEEIQSMANRMESALYDQHDLRRARMDFKELKKEIKKLQAKKKSLSKKNTKLSK